MNIVVLAGGISTERDVSLSSGSKIFAALKKLGHNALFLDVYLGYTGEVSKTLFEEKKNLIKNILPVTDENPDIEAIKKLRDPSVRGFFGPNVLRLCSMADIVFMGLHGENGENGKVQATFDLMGIRYTGTDSVSSMLSMDKSLSKQIFMHCNIPTPKNFYLYKNKPFDSAPSDYPVVVKVANGGSSVGVYVCHDREEFENAKKEGFKFDDTLLVEQYIDGREFSIGVIDGKALPVIEIAPISGFYDYKNKYQEGSTIETCPAIISDQLTKNMQRTAEDVFKVLRLKSYARMDFMVDENGKHYCLEANTLPGMTPTSLLPQEAKAKGMSFEDLCQKLIDVSLKKYIK